MKVFILEIIYRGERVRFSAHVSKSQASIEMYVFLRDIWSKENIPGAPYGLTISEVMDFFFDHIDPGIVRCEVHEVDLETAKKAANPEEGVGGTVDDNVKYLPPEMCKVISIALGQVRYEEVYEKSNLESISSIEIARKIVDDLYDFFVD